MSQGLGNMDGYRVPTIAVAAHDLSRWDFGRPWLQGLNSGDPCGRCLSSTTMPLLRRPAVPRTSAAPRAFERQYATVEITDSVAMMAGHQVALPRVSGRLQQAVQGLEDDVMNGLARYHELTAILDKVAAGELLGRRQDMASNQLLSHAVEQLLARGKRLRDTEAATMNMQIDDVARREARQRRDGRRHVDALRTWRQP